MADYQLGTDYGTGYQGSPQYVMNYFTPKQTPEEVKATDTKIANREAIKGAQSSAAAGGGLGGAAMTYGLTKMAMAPAATTNAAGVTSGGAMAGAAPWIAVGGAAYSYLKGQQEEKAAREQAIADAENNKRKELIALARDAANSEFRIV